MYSSKDILKALKDLKEKGKKRNFLQSIDLAVNLNLDMGKPENRLNEELLLPNGRGKKVRIGVIAEGELAHQAKKVADKVITKEELTELAKDKKAAKKIVNSIEFFIAQADMMPLVGKHLGPILGPRGKMPKPVPVNASLGPVVERLRKTIRLRTKDNPVIHAVVGTEEMEDKLLVQNIEAVMHHLERKLEKGYNDIRSAYLKTTMGKGVKLEASR
jgi:large subunit ribosomal protein L1